MGMPPYGLPLMAAALLSACAVGPDYVRPETKTDEAFGQLDTATHKGEEPGVIKASW